MEPLRLDLVGPRVGYRIPTQADAIVGVRGYRESRWGQPRTGHASVVIRRAARRASFFQPRRPAPGPET